MSQQIAALERSAGIVSVGRSTRGVTLTEAGRLHVDTADTVHAELQTADRQLRELRDHGPPTLTVVTFPSAASPCWSRHLSSLADHPDTPVDITVIEAEPEGALSAIRHGEADLALVYHFHVPRPPRDRTAAAGPGSNTPLVAERLRLVVPVTHPLADRTEVDLAELADDRRIQGWVNPVRFMATLVGEGVGVALLPELALTDRTIVRDLGHQTPSRSATSGPPCPVRSRRNRTAERLLATLRERADALD